MIKNKKIILTLIGLTLIGLILIIIVVFRTYFSYQNSIPETINYSNGRLEMVRIDVATLYPGRVLSIDVEEGQPVKKGAVLAHMQATEPESQLQIATAAKQRAIAAKTRGEAELQAKTAKLNVVKLDYDNALKLRQDKLISAIELEKRKQELQGETQVIAAVQAAINEATAAIQEADAHIAHIQTINNDMQLKSPVDGYVEYKLIEEGSVIPAGGRVVSIFDNSKIHMNVFLPIASISKIKLGDEARIVLDEISAVFPAKITFISREAQFTPKYVETQSEREKLLYKVKLTISVEDALKYAELFKSGLTGNGYVKVDRKVDWPSKLNIKYPE